MTSDTQQTLRLAVGLFIVVALGWQCLPPPRTTSSTVQEQL